MTLVLAHPPIVEAVLDIDCDLPLGQELSALEGPARERFRDHYPTFGQRVLQEHQIETRPDTPLNVSVRHTVAVAAYQFMQEDQKQLVQIRNDGYSFNRLAPYTSLDEYLPEIERTWRIYVSLAAPVQIRLVRLRYINRILLPLVDGKVILGDYFRVAPRLPDEERMSFLGFVHQHVTEEPGTGNQAHTVFASQNLEQGQLPVIFDNSVLALETGDVDNWPWIEGKIRSLRSLKNHIFERSLTEQCLNLFQQD